MTTGSRRLRLGLLALAVALVCPARAAAQQEEPGADWRFPKAGDLSFPKAQDLFHPKPTAFAGSSSGLQVTETGTQVQIGLAADVLFDFDKATLSPKATDALKQAAAIVREKARGRVEIAGHTDAKGDDRYNLRLSQQRANAVKRWFESDGVVASRLSAVGFGRQRPVAPNTKPDGADDPEGRQKNRRVEIRFDK